jgi:hypothetical protein
MNWERGSYVMKDTDYDKVCYWTEQRDEPMRLRNLRTGKVGYSFGCTQEGATVQVRLESGELDSWTKDDCVEVPGTIH